MANGEQWARLRRRFEGRRLSRRVRFTIGNRVELFGSGEAFFAALILRIDAAQHEVALETYIFRADPSGMAVSDALIRAARRGLRVRVITDAVGTGKLSLFNDWRGAGIDHRIYNPPWLFSRFGLSRTHRKLAAVDRRYGYCGGHNIVDDRLERGRPLPFPRWDYTAELEGPVVDDMAAAFDLQWRRIVLKRVPPPSAVPDELSGTPQRPPGTSDPPGAAGAPHTPPGMPGMSGRAGIAQLGGAPMLAQDATPRNARSQRRANPLPPNNLDVPRVAFVARDNINNRRAIEKAYLYAIGRAKREILVANPYFVPGRKVRRALVRAARRGIQITLLIGRKEFSTLDYAVPFLYGLLLPLGVRIGEYDKTILHGKVAVVDGVWGTVGSSNLDALSLVLNHEANVVLVRHPAIHPLRDAILRAYAEATPVDPKRYASRPLFERVMNWVAFKVYRFLMKVLTIGGYD
jgi:cardiolipin synthase